MTEYVVLTDCELGHEVICSRKIAEDFLEEFKDINDDAVYIKDSIPTDYTVDELKEEFDFAIKFFMKGEEDD